MLRRNRKKMMIQLLSLVCGVLLLAAAAAAASANVVFVLDSSGSMWGQVEGKAKITIAKEVLNDLIDGLPQDMQVGLFAYGHRSKGDCDDIEMLVPVGPLDARVMKAKVAALNAKGKTPLCAAVTQAAKALRYTEEKATVILVSDGLETCNADPCGLAAELAMSGVDFTVHVVGFDIAKEEQSQLRCLADKTGGLFLTAGNAQSLREALTQTVAKTKEPPKPVVADPGTAKLTAPASVPVGAEFEVSWEGPDSRNDYIAIAVKDHREHTYRHFTYTEKGNPARLRAPGKTGAHELRYVHSQSGRIIGKADIEVTPVPAAVQPPATAPVARDFDVTWEGPNYAGDYLAICRPGDPDNVYLYYSYTAGGNPGKLRAPSDAGTYEVRYVTAVDTTVLARAPITIEGVGAQVEAPEFVDMAAEFEVSWQGPNNPQDYISIAMPQDGGSGYKAYTYTREGSPLKLRAPSDPGLYEIRYVLEQGRKILAKTPITVLGVVAHVETPEATNAASEFEVSWQGPDNPQDYISIALPGDNGSGYAAYTYTREGSPLKLRAPSDPGQYEVRYVLEQGRKILASAPITVNAVTAQVTAPEAADAAAEFEVSWQGPNNPQDYISIALPKDNGSGYKAYTYTREGSPLKLRAPSDPGQYEIRYVLEQGRKILARAPLTVNAVTAQVTAPGAADAASEFEVSWQGPNNPQDYISIALPGDNGSGYKAYTYTREGSPLKLRAPSDPGQYEVRYILDQGSKILARAPIAVKPVTATVTAPAEAAAGADFQVAWQGPGYAQDYVSIAPRGAGDGEYLGYFYTRDGSPGNLTAPAQPGAYEIRYVMEPGRKILSRTAVIVK